MVVETPILGKTNVGTGIYTTNNANTGLITPQTKLLKIFWCGGGLYNPGIYSLNRDQYDHLEWPFFCHIPWRVGNKSL